jgi:hypothetical protein
MQTTTSNEEFKLTLPFVGRRKEVALLERLHAQGKHVLILGAEGMGKTALVAHLHEALGYHICPVSERLAEICDSLERELGLERVELPLVRRKNRLLKMLAGTKRAVVFDGVTWTTPRVSAFIENVSERVPVWICARSEHPWDIGHVWPLLVRFEKIEIRPLPPAETRALIAAAIRLGLVPPDAADASERLHHLSHGNPGTLCELIAGLATGHYNPHKKFDLRLLDLDRRIEQLPTSGGFHRF